MTPSRPARALPNQPQQAPPAVIGPVMAVPGIEVGSRQSAATQIPARIYTVPFLFVLGYLLVDFGRPHSWVPALGLVRPGVIVLGGGIVSLVANRGLHRVPTLGKYIIAFFVLMVLLVPFSVNSRMAFNFTRDFGLFVFGAVLPMIAFVDNFDRLRTLVRFWVWIHVPLAIYSITHNGVGIGSFLTDENDFALAMNMVIPYAVALLMTEKGVMRRVCVAVACGILVCGSTATMSRGGFIGLVSLVFMMWLRSPKKFVTLSAVVVLAGAVVIATPSSYWKEVQSIETADQEGDTGYERLYLWGIAWRMFLDYPVFGVGPGNYQYNNYSYESPERVAEGRHVWGQVAHSLYFTLLPEYGIVGVMLFLMLLTRTIREQRHVSRTGRALLAATNSSPPSAEERERIAMIVQLSAAIESSMVALLTTGAFIAVLYYPHLWLMVAFTAVLRFVSDEVFATAATPDESGTAVGQHARPAAPRPAWVVHQRPTS